MFFHRPRKLKTGLSTQRIEAFSDGVFAIAITLLILGVTIPDIAPEKLRPGQLWWELLILWPKILSYIISFGVIGTFWVGHHIMFHYIKRSDRTLLWLNTVLLLVISFFPFPASLIGKYGTDQAAVVLYGLTLVVAGLLFELIWLHASRHHRLIDKHLDQSFIRLGSMVVLMAPIVYALAVILAFINPLISIVIYILVPIFYILPGPIDRLVDFEAKE